jgi:photosystem II stability/assembly factor-like uncharacterized protein
MEPRGEDSKLKMQNVPKIVVDRLRAAPSAVHHPDADVLTAFAEHSLAARERATVVDHLAQCHACRDIVMLALPAADDAQSVIRPMRAGWLTWPALRWGLAAVGIAAVASLGIVQYQRTMRPAAMLEQRASNDIFQSQAESRDRVAASVPASTTPAPTTPSAAAQATGNDKISTRPLASAPASSVAERVAPKAVEPKDSERRTAESGLRALARATPSPAAPSPIVHMPAHGATAGGPFSNAASYNQNTLAQQQQVAQAQQNAASAAAVPHASESVTVEVAAGAALQVQTENAQTGNVITADAQSADAQLQAKNQPAPLPSAPPESLFDNSPGLVRAKPAMKAEFGPQWVVTATGGLQRSFDQGNTWQDVNVTANLVSLPTNGRNFTDLTTITPAKANQQQDSSKQSSSSQSSSNRPSSSQALSKQSSSNQGSSNQSSSNQSSSNQSLANQGRAQAGVYKKAAAALVTAPVFRTVTANGGDVWAGGSNATLYHSTDAGNHWTQVIPSAAGSSLSGDVLRVEFTDAQHGKVATSTAETWITGDDGQTWQKQ